MMILIGFLLAVICVLLCVLWKYKRQINDICRQLRFLKEHDSNMMITTDFSKGSFAELSTVLNDFLADQKEERKSYQKRNRQFQIRIRIFPMISALRSHRSMAIFSCLRQVKMRTIEDGM